MSVAVDDDAANQVLVEELTNRHRATVKAPPTVGLAVFNASYLTFDCRICAALGSQQLAQKPLTISLLNVTETHGAGGSR